MGNMRFKVGDRVRIKSLDWYNKNKDELGVISCDLQRFTPNMSWYCGKILIISCIIESKGCYEMLDTYYYWTDEMIEGLAEYPKIAIQGDPTRGVSVIDALITLGGENDKDSIATTKHACYFIDHEGKIRSRLLENLPEGFKLYTLEEWRKENMEKENADKKELLLGLVETQKGQELIPHKDYEIKQDGDKFYLVKKKKEYPKTYEECCKVLRYAYEQGITMRGVTEEEGELFRCLIVLKRCRDAYWKIAGEEMGLDKSWEPDTCQIVYNMGRDSNRISFYNDMFGGYFILEFPTKEMRDTFYENFKELIESVKELL